MVQFPHILLLLLLLLALSLTTTASASADLPYSASSSTCGLAGSDGLKPLRREVYDGGRIIDITHFYREDMPTWGSADGIGRFLWLAHSMKNGSGANNSEMKMAAHAGTHVDAPGHVFDHYYDSGFDVDTLDLEVLNGPALLLDVPRDKNITAEVMESLHIPRGVHRLLFRTLNTDRSYRQLMWKKEFESSYCGFTEDGARWLVKNTDVKLIGIDYLSVATFDDALPSHLIFLESREIILVESLKLDSVKAGLYTLHCLPLRLRGSDGSPARLSLICSSGDCRLKSEVTCTAEISSSLNLFKTVG